MRAHQNVRVSPSQAPALSGTDSQNTALRVGSGNLQPTGSPIVTRTKSYNSVERTNYLQSRNKKANAASLRRKRSTNRPAPDGIFTKAELQSERYITYRAKQKVKARGIWSDKLEAIFQQGMFILKLSYGCFYWSILNQPWERFLISVKRRRTVTLNNVEALRCRGPLEGTSTSLISSKIARASIDVESRSRVTFKFWNISRRTMKNVCDVRFTQKIIITDWSCIFRATLGDKTRARYENARIVYYQRAPSIPYPRDAFSCQRILQRPCNAHGRQFFHEHRNDHNPFDGLSLLFLPAGP